MITLHEQEINLKDEREVYNDGMESVSKILSHIDVIIWYIYLVII